MKKILIVEDDITICEELEELLQNNGYQALAIRQFTNVKEQLLSASADLILLDINIPGLNGEMLLKEFRKESQTPVIMVTSRTSEVDEVLSMSLGADDYITKPYNPVILLLRIAAILKRTEYNGEVLTYRDLVINLPKGTLTKRAGGNSTAGETELSLTKNEMLILQTLLNNRNRIVKRDELMTVLWDNDEFINDNALTVNISRLRSKLSDFGYPDAIETRKKQGYLLVEE
ncbi:MAG: response regulator transcription factor [Lachnospiraceae bacterium]|nr:response regulator transcription factor [Lachnospiraceae bacterium]